MKEQISPKMITTDPNIDKIKLQEDLRFQIERMIWKVEIDNLVKISSFTVNLQNGAVKSVRVKLMP